VRSGSADIIANAVDDGDYDTACMEITRLEIAARIAGLREAAEIASQATELVGRESPRALIYQRICELQSPDRGKG